jgi:hypothetical protein
MTFEPRSERETFLLYGYGGFLGPCAHGRSPWDRCDECGEKTAVEAASKRVDQLVEENRRALSLLRQFVERLGHDEHCDCLICYDLEDTIKDAKALLSKDGDG